MNTPVLEDRKALLRKLDQIIEIGVLQFAVLFDDIPSNLSDSDKKQFNSFAAAQSQVADEILCH